jgi:hypothetical protein
LLDLSALGDDASGRHRIGVWHLGKNTIGKVHTHPSVAKQWLRWDLGALWLLRGLVATHDAAPAALEYYIFGADIHEGSIPFQSAFIL